MKDAIFDKSDCENCEFRCGANALFSEYSQDKCTHASCYDDKVKYHYISLIEGKVSQGYILVKDESMHSDMQEFCKELENTYLFRKKNYQNSDWFSITELPEPPEREEDDSDEDWAETLETYQEELKEYETDLAEENERLQNGFQRALRIGWNDISEIIIKFKDENEASPEQLSQNNKLSELQSKDKRNAEIKVEKVTEELKTLISKSDYDTYSYPTTELEKEIVIAAMITKCDWQFVKQTEREFDKEISYLDNCKAILGTPKEAQIIRAFIKNHVTSYASSVREQLTAISKEVFNDDTLKIELKHEDTYLKRKENIDKQIKELSDANTEK